MIKKYKSPLFLLFLLFTLQSAFAQKQEISLEDIFKNYEFSQESIHGINWMNDGRYYSTLSDGKIIKFDITKGEPIDTIVDAADLVPEGSNNPLEIAEYTFSADESKMLIGTENESIYRRSSKAYFYVYDLDSRSLQRLVDGDKQSYATFSPDGAKVAFVRDNNLFYVSLSDMQLKQLTSDGKFNHIIHGSADWVYEEEFAFAQAFSWSPDSKKIAYYTFDEGDVKEYNMQLWGGLYPEDYRFKYPKAGEKNSEIKISVYHLEGNETVGMDIGSEKDIYIPRIYWTSNPDLLSIIRMNRLQNKLEILHGQVATGETEAILTEESNTYVDLNYNDDLRYLSDGETFIRTSEQDGYKHLYHHNMDGSLIRQVTEGDWEVSSLIGIDEQKKLVYYLSTEDSPLERQLYVINLKGRGKKKLSEQEGTHAVNMNPDFTYYINSHSSAETPLKVSLHSAPSGDLVKMLEENQALANRLEKYDYVSKEFFDFTIDDGTKLFGYMIKPADFDAEKEYPVLMYVYGGPGSQQVTNSWGGSREAWFNYLAQQGYIVACIDNRGTGGRGRDFKHITYAQLGKYEVEDQIAGAQYLGNLNYVDESRIGIWGWSYGGYMSSLALMMGPDVFKAAIAVAPVTNWRFYDSIYTERYLKTPQENPEGYDAFSPVTHVDKLEGNLLLIHGTGDDNVHFQNSVALENALIAAGKQFESFYYPNRNHGIYGGNTSMHLYTMMSEFLMENL